MKPQKKILKIEEKNIHIKIIFGGIVLVLLLGISGVGFFIVKTTNIVKNSDTKVLYEVATAPIDKTPEFPLGVDPLRKEISENPIVDSYFEEHISAKEDSTKSRTSWFPKILGRLALFNWYQNLASLSSRVLVIQSGERKEQIADHFAKILGWDTAQKETFLKDIEHATPELFEGKFVPGTYTVPRGATPEEVMPLILERFNTEILSRYGKDTESVVPLMDALIIASLLEREAYDFEDMRQISGVIWNRLFIDMKLQIDATLQYAKGSKPSEPWWPKVKPSDKYIASVYNTYEHVGLPPAPIANSSLDAILAALNPKKTDCMYYFHDKQAEFHCAPTYKEHVELLKQYYGRGK